MTTTGKVTGRQWAGTSLFLGCVAFFMGMLLAEVLYPGYSVSHNYISDLGVGPEPSATLFNTSVFLFGLAGAVASFLLYRQGTDRGFVLALLVSSAGAMGVGVFHENIQPLHTIAAVVAFGGGAIVSMLSYRVAGRPLAYVGATLGAVSLTALILMGAQTYLGLGAGGMERVVLYPAFLWITGLGALLMLERAP